MLWWAYRACTWVSLALLLLCVLAHCLLPSQRSPAGFCQLLLVLALLPAQGLLLVAADARVAWPWLCSLLGACLHYAWLAVAAAQTACTFHLFFSLSFPLRSLSALARPAALKARYLAGVTCVPAALLAVTLTWQYAAWGLSGYGGRACYITRPEVRILALLAPLMISVAANVAMFVFTLVRLRNTNSRPRNSGKRQVSLAVYCKLSVVTGATWLLLLLGAASGSDAAQYALALAQALQGALAFLALLVNARVLAQLRARCCSSRATQHQVKGMASISGASTTTKM